MLVYLCRKGLYVPEMTSKKKGAQFFENIAEASTACLVTMVQGNLAAIAVSHLLIASQTGLVAGTVASLAILTARTGKRWLISLLLGVVTAVVDFFVHPGDVWEAAVTGLGAALLSYLVGLVVRYLGGRKKPSAD